MPRRTVALLLLATAAALETLHLSNKRSCLFHAPEETTTPVPLVVVLHGYNVEPLNTLDFYFSDLKRLAEERGLAIAAPRGRRLGARGNDGSLCWAAGFKQRYFQEYTKIHCLFAQARVAAGPRTMRTLRSSTRSSRRRGDARPSPPSSSWATATAGASRCAWPAPGGT